MFILYDSEIEMVYNTYIFSKNFQMSTAKKLSNSQFQKPTPINDFGKWKAALHPRQGLFMLLKVDGFGVTVCLNKYGL